MFRVVKHSSPCLERAEWAEADRDRAHQGRMRAEARIKELEEARRPPGL